MSLSPMNRSPDPLVTPEPRAYASPKLTDHGSIACLTATGNTGVFNGVDGTTGYS